MFLKKNYLPFFYILKTYTEKLSAGSDMFVH